MKNPLRDRAFLTNTLPPVLFVLGLALLLGGMLFDLFTLAVLGAMAWWLCAWLLPSPADMLVESITKGWLDLEPMRRIPGVGTLMGEASMSGNVFTGSLWVVPDGWVLESEDFDHESGDGGRWTVALVREQDQMYVNGFGATKAEAREQAVAEAKRLDGDA